MARRLYVVAVLVLAGAMLASAGLMARTPEKAPSAGRFARRYLHVELIEAPPVPQLDALCLEDSDETSAGSRVKETQLPGRHPQDAAAPATISAHVLPALSGTQPLIYRLCKLLI
jgi:hypothetical protein